MRKLPMAALVSTLMCAFGPAGARQPSPVRSGDNDHPRLFVSRERLEALRGLIKVEGSHHALAYGAMKDRVDNNRAGAGQSGSYLNSYRAREAAMMALLASDAAVAKEYAAASFDAFSKCSPQSGSGLARGMHSIGMAIAYDWCRSLWTDARRAEAARKMAAALDAWPAFTHANLGDVRGSNWVAVTRGGEMVMLLAAGEEKRRADRFALLKRELGLHIRNGFGSLGISQEGIGYTEYPGAFLLPAVFACASIGDDELIKAARTRAWWTSALYTHTFQSHGRKTLQTGVTSGGTLDQGWSSLTLNLCPSDSLPYYLWWYDRHQGRLAPEPPAEKFDAARAGTVWALLYYPEKLKAKDPTGVCPAGVADDRGYYFFRNRWKDANDIQVSIMADAHHHGHAWDQPEQLAINLLAYDTRFFGGPVKKRDDKLYSTLLVDGKYNVEGSTSMTGRKVAFEAGKTGGYAIVDGGALYEALGVEQARRHLLVDFLPGEGGAVLSTLDRITSARKHAYTWQANLGDSMKSKTGREAGRPYFLLAGRRGFVKGWVLHPADAKVSKGGPLRIETAGANADVWVVMLVASGDPPAAAVSGEGLRSTIEVAGRTVTHDAARDRLVCK
ncbi:MAG: hypothetical protein WBF17_14730 [Phycisphaerae bacterium]